MIYPHKGPEFARHIRECSDVLKVINDILIKNQRNFDSAVVQTCLDMIEREFMVGQPASNVVHFPTTSTHSATGK